MRTGVFIWIGLAVSFASTGALLAGNPVPVNGVLDLRNTTFTSNSLYHLNGEWEFHWQRLLTPDTDPGPDGTGDGIIVKVPSYWESYQVGGQQLPGQGYGTYALTVLLPEGYRQGLCIDIPLFDVTHAFYLNQRLVSRNGKVGTSRETEEPWYEPSRFCYVPDSDTLRLLVQVSNFHHRRGGYWQTMLLGGSDRLIQRSEIRKIYNYSTIGILFFFTIFFIIFRLFSRKETAMLLFALTALGMLIRSVNTGLYFSNFFVYTPWSWQIRMEYTGTYLAHMFGMLFLHRIFPRSYMKVPLTANTVLMVLLIVSVFALPVHLFSYGMIAFQPLILLFLLHYLVVSFRSMLKGRAVSAIFFVSLALFIATLVNDILLANSAGSVSGNYLSQLSFQVFVLAMAVVIIMEWVSNYNERVRLESSLRFRNKVLSVIAHDLKNPVASIAQFSDLLMNKPELSGKQKILESLAESSQAAVTLLDNLLYWGRSQRDELTVTPVILDMSEVLADVDSLYSHMAIQKGVTLKTEAFPDTRVYADRAMVNIVIRNLVSNAIKFTPSSGSVSVQVQPEADQVRISVTDTGVGIKPEILEEFDKEGQIRTTPGTEKELGTGMGLQLVSDLVRKNGGRLTIDSTEGKGSSFSFTLPGITTRTNENS